MKELKQVYVALGGNIGEVSLVFEKILEKLFLTQEIFDLKTSRFYQTTPVSDVPQNAFRNAVCSFKTTYTAEHLLQILQSLEKEFGKKEKPKNFPRPIDLDILFFDERIIKSQDLEIPHPKWKERLFVLTPLLDLTEEIKIISEQGIEKVNISALIEELKNKNEEKVILI